MKEIAIIGFGVVGGGVAALIDENAPAIRRMAGDEVHVKYILDLRDFPDSPYGDRVIHDVNILLDDPEIALVVETMGGVNPALTFSREALSRGKHVVTSNKELVAKHGKELMELAAANGAAYLYEASVGGGIPEIRSMRTSLAGDEIDAVSGILNGTTNYILTRMRDGGISFEEALAEAQELGYAEKDPSADIHGFDAQRKIMILTAVATGYIVKEEDVYTETMSRLTVADMDAAKRIGGAVRLIGSFRREGECAAISVCPRIVMNDNPLAHINDVYNGVAVTGRLTGDVLYYGRGAGRYPTAGSVIADIIAAFSGAYKCESHPTWEAAPAGFVKDFAESSCRMYIRVSGSRAEIQESAALLFGDVEILDASPAGKTEFITPVLAERVIREAMPSLPGSVESAVRML
ncbi:MAG: homoserine dehydrogenase [Ruminococcaceae bacterium]|nr:homoserine dehydrogenase [Oscillospiraceae bacterium]